MGFHTENTYQGMQMKAAFLLICTEPAQEDLTSKMNFNSSSAIITCRTVGAAPDAGCSQWVHKGMKGATISVRTISIISEIWDGPSYSLLL